MSTRLLANFETITDTRSRNGHQHLSWAVDKTRNMEHSGTFRNIPEHEKIKIFFYEKMIN